MIGILIVLSNLWLYQVCNSGSQSGGAQFYQFSLTIVENASFHSLHIYTYLHTHHTFSCMSLPLTGTVFQQFKPKPFSYSSKTGVVCTMWRQPGI